MGGGSVESVHPCSAERDTNSPLRFTDTVLLCITATQTTTRQIEAVSEEDRSPT